METIKKIAQILRKIVLFNKDLIWAIIWGSVAYIIFGAYADIEGCIEEGHLEYTCVQKLCRRK